jgi:hypothetical protein
MIRRAGGKSGIRGCGGYRGRGSVLRYCGLIERGEAVVDAGIEILVAADVEASNWYVGGRNAELLGHVEISHLLYGVKDFEEKLLCTSLLPLPKPLMTVPRSFNGKGDCGESGPAIGSRGPSGRTIVLLESTL